MADDIEGPDSDSPRPRATIGSSDHAAIDDPVERWVALGLFLLVAAVYLLTATYDGVQVNDTRETNVSGWSLATRGTLAVPDGWEGRMRWTQEGADGEYYTDRFPGVILVSAAAYWVADRFGSVPEPASPILLNYAPGGVAAALSSALAIMLLYRTYRLLVERRWAIAGALTMAFATGMWSVSANILWTHSLTAVALAGGMLAVGRDRFATSGAWFAFGVISRPQTAVIAAVVGIWEGVSRRRIAPVVRLGAVAFIGVLALSLYSQVLFGTWLPLAGYSTARVGNVVSTDGGEFANRVANVLLQRERGFFVYTPIALALLPFLWRGWRVAPAWVRASAVGGVLYAGVQLRANTWYGGHDYFGHRLLLESLVAASPLLVLTARQVLPRARPMQIVVSLVILGSVVLHGIGATVLRVPNDGPARWQQILVEECEQHPTDPACEEILDG